MLRHVPPPLWALLFLAATYLLSMLPGLNGWPVWATRPYGLIMILASLALLAWAMLQFRLLTRSFSQTRPRITRLSPTAYSA